MNIILLAAEFPPRMRGGMANYSYNLAKRLAANNDVNVISLSEYSADRNYALNLRFVRDATRELRMARKERKGVIVYAISFRPEFCLIGFFAKSLALSFVSHGIGADIYTFHPVFVLSRRLIYQISDQLICGAKFQKEMMLNQGVSAQKVHAVLGGIDTKVFKPLQRERKELRRDLEVENRFVLLSLGRLVERKGFDDAIKALTYLPEIEDLCLLIVGKGPEQLSLMRLTKKLSLESKVKFLGFVSAEKLPKIYNAADAFVAPFKAIGRDIEGFPLVVQEAQACGLPIVSTITAGLPELVENNTTGFLVPPESPREIAKKIRTLYDDSALRKKMGRNARRRAFTILDWTTTIDKIEKILHAACDSKE